MVAPWYYTLDGTRLKGQAQAELALWKVRPPLRVSTQTLGVLPSGALPGEAELRVFGCRGGRFRLTLNSSGDRAVTIRRDDLPYGTAALRGAMTWRRSIPAAPAEGGMCTLQVSVPGGIFASRFDFVRNARG